MSFRLYCYILPNSLTCGWVWGVAKIELRTIASNFLSLRFLWLLHVCTSAQKECGYSLFDSGAHIRIVALTICEFRQDT